MRMLRVLHDLFYQPMADGGFFSLEELQNIFPSLDELIEVHCECRAAAPLHAPGPAPSSEASAIRLRSQHVLVHPSLAASVPALGTTPPQIPRAHTLGRTRHVSECMHDRGTGPSAPRVRETHLQPQPRQLPAGLCMQPAGPDHTPSSPPPTALFLDRLMKRRQDSGYLIKEIGDVLLARVRAPSPGPRPLLPARDLEARVLGPQPCRPVSASTPGWGSAFPTPT